MRERERERKREGGGQTGRDRQTASHPETGGALERETDRSKQRELEGETERGGVGGSGRSKCQMLNIEGSLTSAPRVQIVGVKSQRTLAF